MAKSKVKKASTQKKPPSDNLAGPNKLKKPPIFLIATAVLLLFVIGLVVFLVASKKKNKVLEFESYIGRRFALSIPQNWERQSGQGKTAFLDQKRDGFQSNVVIASQTVEDDVTPKEVSISSTRIQEKDYPNFSLVEEKSSLLHSLPAVIKTYTWQDNEKKLHFFQIQAYVKAGREMYILTATCLKNLSQEYEPIFQRIINSFVVVGESSVSQPTDSATIKDSSPSASKALQKNPTPST